MSEAGVVAIDNSSLNQVSRKLPLTGRQRSRQTGNAEPPVQRAHTRTGLYEYRGDGHSRAALDMGVPLDLPRDQTLIT